MTLQSMIDSFGKSLGDVPIEPIEIAISLITETIEKKGCVFICGNGGSGANANLFATIMSKYLKAGKPGFHIVSLNSNMSVITYLAENDGYDKIFSAQIDSFARKSDLLITISCSGNSSNILEAIRASKKIGMKNIGLTGVGGGKLSSMVDLPIIVNSDNIEQIESVHTVIIYAISAGFAQSMNIQTKMPDKQKLLDLQGTHK